MKITYFFRLACYALLVLSTSVSAAEDADIQEVRKNTANLFLSGEQYNVSRTPVPGIYELDFIDGFIYVSKDGKYAFKGEIIDIIRNVSITEEKLSQGRLKIFSEIQESEMLVFTPKDGKYLHTVNIFTDIDCSYCRKLHKELDDYLRFGIRVRYLFYPRTGKGSASYKKAVSVWCSDSRHDALTLAKQGRPLPEKTCDNPVDKHMRVAGLLQVTGTPMIILEDGGRMPGYIPAASLFSMLQQRKSVAQASQK